MVHVSQGPNSGVEFWFPSMQQQVELVRAERFQSPAVHACAQLRCRRLPINTMQHMQESSSDHLYTAGTPAYAIGGVPASRGQCRRCLAVGSAQQFAARAHPRKKAGDATTP